MEHLKASPLRLILTLLSNIRLGWKCLLGADTLAYYKHLSITVAKKFSEIVFRSQPVCNEKIRQHYNILTSFVDASNVYGSEQVKIIFNFSLSLSPVFLFLSPFSLYTYLPCISFTLYLFHPLSLFLIISLISFLHSIYLSFYFSSLRIRTSNFF